MGSVVGIHQDISVKEVLNWIAEVDEEHRSIDWEDFDFYSIPIIKAAPTRTKYSEAFDKQLCTDWRPYIVDANCKDVRNGKRPAFCSATSALIYGKRYAVFASDGNLGATYLKTKSRTAFRKVPQSDFLPETDIMVRPHVMIYESGEGSLRYTLFGYRFEGRNLVVPVPLHLIELVIDYGYRYGSILKVHDARITNGD